MTDPISRPDREAGWRDNRSTPSTPNLEGPVDTSIDTSLLDDHERLILLDAALSELNTLRAENTQLKNGVLYKQMFSRIQRAEAKVKELEAERDTLFHNYTTDLPARDARIAETQHLANEWADCATSGLQWLRNIRDGISTPTDAIENMLICIEHCQEVGSALSTTGAGTTEVIDECSASHRFGK